MNRYTSFQVQNLSRWTSLWIMAAILLPLVSQSGPATAARLGDMSMNTNLGDVLHVGDGFSIQPTPTPACESAIEVYSQLSDQELEHLARRRSEPYADTVTVEEVEWLREYREATGRVYRSGNLPVLIQANSCRNAESGATGSASSDESEKQDRACKTWASKLTEHGLGYTVQDIEILTGCRQAVSGIWFYPIGSDDPRLSGPASLSPMEIEQTQELRRVLKAQIGELNGILRTTLDRTVVYDAANPQSLAQGLEELRVKSYPGDASFGEQYGLQSSYEDILVDYIQDPNHIVLRRYVVWWAERRIATMPVGLCETRMNPMLCDAYIQNMGFYRAPWTWELDDELLMMEYLDWTLTSSVGVTIPA